MAARTQELWTLEGLKIAVERALATSDYGGAQNGQIRSVPDLRSLRYYTTLGLMDRPSELRGRTAYYGRRHLLQVVAIKRLQSEGHSLADIQAELGGATDTKLAQVARIPEGTELPATSPVEAEVAPSRRSRSFWAEVPPTETKTEADAVEVAATPLLAGVPLGGAHLLFTPNRPLSEDDLRAVREAAASVLAVLAERGLLAAPAKGELS